MRIYFSLKLVACENSFLSVLFCGNLFLPWFVFEAGFYLYSTDVYASDVLGDVPMYLVHYF